MALHKCPGLSPGNYKPGDIQFHPCLHCGYELEFWKDDLKLRCPHCGGINANPDLGNSCFTYCRFAAECLGGEKGLPGATSKPTKGEQTNG